MSNNQFPSMFGRPRPNPNQLRPEFIQRPAPQDFNSQYNPRAKNFVSPINNPRPRPFTRPLNSQYSQRSGIFPPPPPPESSNNTESEIYEIPPAYRSRQDNFHPPLPPPDENVTKSYMIPKIQKSLIEDVTKSSTPGNKFQSMKNSQGTLKKHESEKPQPFDDSPAKKSEQNIDLDKIILNLAENIQKEKSIYTNFMNNNNKKIIEPLKENCTKILDILSNKKYIGEYKSKLGKDYYDSYIKLLSEYLQQYNKSEFLKNVPEIPANLTLNCLYKILIRDAKSIAKSLIGKIPNGPRQFKCPDPDCFHILNDEELVLILNEQYKDFIENYEKIPLNPFCMICGNSSSTIIKIHENHTICKICFEKYAEYYMKGKQTIKTAYGSKLQEIKCPARDCEFLINDEFFRKLDMEIYRKIINKIDPNSYIEEYKQPYIQNVPEKTVKSIIFLLY